MAEASPKTMPGQPPVRFPLRVQITLLLLGFVGIVAVAFFYLTFSFVERDKLGTTRELQTFQVVDASRKLSESLNRSRLQLREAGMKLLDPSRTLNLEETEWQWVWVRGKSWVSSKLGNTTIPESEGFSVEGEKFELVSDPADSGSIVFKEPLLVREKGREFRLIIYGKIAKNAAFGEASQLSRGPLRGILVDLSGVGESFKPTTLAQVNSRILLAEVTDGEKFSEIFINLSTDHQKAIAQPLRGATREFPAVQDTSFVSWSAVDSENLGSSMLAVAFSRKSEILKAFQTTKLALGLMVLLVVGLGIIVAGLLGGRLSRPIEKLVKATKVLETGQFDVKVDLKRSDEIGVLAASFNHMGQALQEREQALIAAQSALVQNEKLAALGTLSAGIAHEIKNPLAGILGHADMTVQRVKSLTGIDVSPVLKHLETIQKEVKRCRGIIDNLMRFSRQDREGKTDYESVDLEIVAWDAIHLMEHPLNLAKVRVEKEFTADASMIFGNANQIEQVLLNMLQNAGHAMPEGGVVTVSTEHFANPETASVGKFVAMAHQEFQGPFMRITVRDQGIGMTEEVQRKIFEPFFTTKPKGVGTGLGLSVTMAILADHKARVSLNSAPGHGTAFLMDFMVKEPRNKAVFAQLEEIRSRKGGGPVVSTDVSAKTKKPSESQVTMAHPADSSENPGIRETEIAGGGFSENEAPGEATRDFQTGTGFAQANLPPPPRGKNTLSGVSLPPTKPQVPENKTQRPTNKLPGPASSPKFSLRRPAQNTRKGD